MQYHPGSIEQNTHLLGLCLTDAEQAKHLKLFLLP